MCELWFFLSRPPLIVKIYSVTHYVNKLLKLYFNIIFKQIRIGNTNSKKLKLMKLSSEEKK